MNKYNNKRKARPECQPDGFFSYRSDKGKMSIKDRGPAYPA